MNRIVRTGTRGSRSPNEQERHTWHEKGDCSADVLAVCRPMYLRSGIRQAENGDSQWIAGYCNSVDLLEIR